MITSTKRAPALTETARGTLTAIYIANFPSLSLLIPECQLLVGVGKIIPHKITWNNLQHKKVFQENDHLQYNGTSALHVRAPILGYLLFFYTIWMYERMIFLC
jgi:hypothetical protein